MHSQGRVALALDVGQEPVNHKFAWTRHVEFSSMPLASLGPDSKVLPFESYAFLYHRWLQFFNSYWVSEAIVLVGRAGPRSAGVVASSAAHPTLQSSRPICTPPRRGKIQNPAIHA
jgi:hypothetical protein